MKETAGVKVCCDTSAHFHNVKRHEDTREELDALAALLKLRAEGKLTMYRTRAVRAEADATKECEQRSKLQADYEALDQIMQDESVLGFSLITDHVGTCIANPIVSDILDERLYQRLKQRGFKERDAQHVTHAVVNNCDVFLTLDGKTIIDPHRDWLEQEFPCLKIRRPSELFADLLNREAPA